jgi:hypothetical protein
MAQECSGFVLTVYSTRGLPPERSDFEDAAKAEKAFTDAKSAAILWQTLTVESGLGWVKVKEKEASIVVAAPVTTSVAAGIVAPVK